MTAMDLAVDLSHYQEMNMTAMDLAVDLNHYQEMNMTAMDLAVDLNHYKKSGEWDLIGELHVILLSLLHRLSTKTTFTDENLDLEMLGHMISNLFVINV